MTAATILAERLVVADDYASMSRADLILALGRKDMYIHVLSNANEVMREQCSAYQEMQADLRGHVYDVAGASFTIEDAMERGLFRALCIGCSRPECDGGCPINDCADIENWETER